MEGKQAAETYPRTAAIFAGGMLVLLPSVALFFGMGTIHKEPTVGLPLMAIFGVVILIGSLALTATLFHQLGLSSQSDALGLPAGSIRAAIALSLIVLFAIIAIMLFQTLSEQTPNEPYWIYNVAEADLLSVQKANTDRVVMVVPTKCTVARANSNSIPAQGADAVVPGNSPAVVADFPCYKVALIRGVPQNAVDLAKQLLTLIGTLMTSVTSFYFAAKTSSNDAPPKDSNPKASTPTPESPDAVTPASGNALADSDKDGCGTEVAAATKDEDLPAASGGVG